MKDLVLVPSGCCPTCGQTIKATAKRICGACQKPIAKGHKFLFDGSTVRHRVCAEPDCYTPTPPAPAPPEERTP